jgi:hypothetical protein
MNADGTEQHVVCDPSGSNTDAWARSWSPDGRYVAFTRISFIYYLGNWYWTDAYLYKWDSYGSGTYKLGTQDTDWHPDLQTTDGAPPVSSMQALPAQSPAPFTVVWSGYDVGDSGLESYDVQVRDGASGAWTDWQVGTAATEASYLGVGGHTYYFRSRAWDWSYNVEPWPPEYDAWTMVEAFPPRTAVGLLPAYSRNNLPIGWSGSDPGGSGIQTYDVQYRDLAGGNWTDWQMATTDTSATFSGTSGHTYAFRSRATDTAQNTESWPPGNGDTSTILYTWGARGTVSDNTGTPVIGANTTTTPTAFAVLPSDTNGAYAAYVADDAATYSLSWGKNGYGGLPATNFDAIQDAKVDVVLPPADNVVLDSGFEAGGWEIGGEITPVITSSIKHTGDQSALLGKLAGFGPIINIGGAAENAQSRPAIAIDSEGSLHVMWDDSHRILYATRRMGESWSFPVGISGAYDCTDPAIVIDDANTLYAVGYKLG